MDAATVQVMIERGTGPYIGNTNYITGPLVLGDTNTCVASGVGALSVGHNNQALGDYSIASGNGSTAWFNYAVSGGYHVTHLMVTRNVWGKYIASAHSCVAKELARKHPAVTR